MGRAKLACLITVDAVDRILYGRYTGTPQAHLDRISEFCCGRPGAGTAPAPRAAGPAAPGPRRPSDAGRLVNRDPGWEK